MNRAVFIFLEGTLALSLANDLEFPNCFKNLSSAKLISNVVVEPVRYLLGQWFMLLEIFLLVDHRFAFQIVTFDKLCLVSLCLSELLSLHQGKLLILGHEGFHIEHYRLLDNSLLIFRAVISRPRFIRLSMIFVLH